MVKDIANGFVKESKQFCQFKVNLLLFCGDNSLQYPEKVNVIHLKGKEKFGQNCLRV